MLDITVALATGRLSPALEDLLGSGPQTSERVWRLSPPVSS